MENVSNSNEKTKFTSLFSKRLRETRNERGIKLKEFAEKIDVSINALSNYENGKRIPPCDILRKLEEIRATEARKFYNESIEIVHRLAV